MGLFSAAKTDAVGTKDSDLYSGLILWSKDVSGGEGRVLLPTIYPLYGILTRNLFMLKILSRSNFHHEAIVNIFPQRILLTCPSFITLPLSLYSCLIMDKLFSLSSVHLSYFSYST